MKTRSRSARARSRFTRQTAPMAFPGVVVDVGGMPFGWPRSTPVSEAEQRWLDHACTLAAAATREIHGPDEIGALIVDVSVVGRAAEQLWAAMPGAPSWVMLDVDALMARFDAESPTLRETAAATLLGFATWMRVHRHLAVADALVLAARLEPHAPAMLFELGYTRSPLPASLRPS